MTKQTKKTAAAETTEALRSLASDYTMQADMGGKSTSTKLFRIFARQLREIADKHEEGR